jgi:hypothetical protein
VDVRAAAIACEAVPIGLPYLITRSPAAIATKRDLCGPRGIASAGRAP